jgi:allophanate hydrolase subunit 2
MIEFLNAPIQPLITKRPADPFAAGLLRDVCGVGTDHPIYEIIASRFRIRAKETCVITVAGTVFRPERGNSFLLKKDEEIILSPSEPGYRDYLIAQIPEGNQSRKWLSASNFEYVKTRTIRVEPGPEFTPGCLDGSFTIKEHNRIGIRLERHQPLSFEHREIITSPVGWGTIQMPADGHPIILMPDCQQTGGYPRIGFVRPEDLRVLGQLRTGDLLVVSCFLKC